MNRRLLSQDRTTLGALSAPRRWFDFNTTWTEIKTATTSITANASAHTKGAWTELIASTSARSNVLVLAVGGVNATGADTALLADIGIGAAGAEAAIIADVAFGSALAIPPMSVTLPLVIPAGTRISARTQSIVTGGKTCSIYLALYNAPNPGPTPSAVDVLGTSTLTSAGTPMSGGAGTWVEIAASTSRGYSAVAIVPSASDNAMAAINVIYEVGVGAVGSEVAFGSCRTNYNSTETCALWIPMLPTTFGRAIPAGSRLAVRHDIAANPQKYDVTLIGVPS